VSAPLWLLVCLCAALNAMPFIIDRIVIKTIVIVIAWTIRAVYDFQKARRNR
jgi:hypothetical protein